MATKFETQLVISAQDNTAGAFSGILRRVDEIGRVLKRIEGAERSAARPLDGIARQAEGVDRAARSVEKLGRALSGVTSHEGRISSMIKSLGALDLAAGAAGAGLYGQRVWKAGTSLQDEKISLRMAGIKPDEIEHFQNKSLDLSKRFPMVPQIDILHMMKEARSVLTHPEEVDHIIEPLVRAKAVLDHLDPSQHSSEGLGLLVRGAESIGAAQDPQKFAGLLDRYVKAMQVMGKTINPEQIYQFDKYLKNSGSQLSDRFLGTTGLSLAQEIGGSSAGNSINMMQQYIRTGWRNQHTAIKEMVRVGLISGNDVEHTKTGEIKGIKAGRLNYLRGQNTALTDPDTWLYNVALPAMQKSGITSFNDQLAFLSKVFPRSDAATFFGKILSQRAAFENHAALYDQALGTSASDLLNTAASANLRGVSDAVTNLASNAASPLMEPAARNLNSLAGALNNLAEDSKQNPARGVGYLGAGAVGTTLAGAGLWRLLTGSVTGAAVGGGAGVSLVGSYLFDAYRDVLQQIGIARQSPESAKRDVDWTMTIAKAASSVFEYFRGHEPVHGEMPQYTDQLRDLEERFSEINAQIKAIRENSRVTAPFIPPVLLDQQGDLHNKINNLKRQIGPVSDGIEESTSKNTKLSIDMDSINKAIDQMNVQVSGEARVTNEGTFRITIDNGNLRAVIDEIVDRKASNMPLRSESSSGPGSTGRSSPDAVAPSPVTGRFGRN